MPERRHTPDARYQDFAHEVTRRLNKLTRRVWAMVAWQIVVLAISWFLFHEVQDQRRDAIRQNCQEVNQRHDNVITRLDTLTAALPPGPRADRAKASRDATVSLLEAIVPHENCDDKVERLVR